MRLIVGISRTDGWSFETLSELTRLSSRSSSDDSGLRSKSGHGHHESLVEILPVIAFKRNGHSDIPGWAKDSKSEKLSFQHLSIDDLYKESKALHFRLPSKHMVEEAGYSHAWLFQTPIIDAPKMLTVSYFPELTVGYDISFVSPSTGRSFQPLAFNFVPSTF